MEFPHGIDLFSADLLLFFLNELVLLILEIVILVAVIDIVKNMMMAMLDSGKTVDFKQSLLVCVV